MSEMTFETALKELENLVHRLEQGQVNLEEAVSAYEKGAKLKAHCEEKLRQARMRIEQISLIDESSLTLKPFGEDTA